MSRIRLLLVEDNVVAGEGVRLALTEYGFDVRVVNAGRDACGALKRHGAQVVVLDLSLPDLHGTVVAEMLRRDKPDLPIIVVSGHAKCDSLDPLLASPNTAFLHKPYSLDELVGLIHSRVSPETNTRRETTHAAQAKADGETSI